MDRAQSQGRDCDTSAPRGHAQPHSQADTDRAGTKVTGVSSGGKVQRFMIQIPPQFFLLAVSEGTEGQGAHKPLPQVGGSWAQLNTIHPPPVAARCHKKTESCCGASTGEPLLDSNTALSKQKACVAAQESVTCPKVGSSTGRMSQPCTELLQAQSFERQLCSES